MSRPLLGKVRVVSDKSITHRGVLLAALAQGRSVVYDPNDGADCAATLRAVELLGATVHRDPACWAIEGGPLREPEEVLDLGNSGTGLRLVTGVAAAHPFFTVLTGDRSLCSRPMERIIRPLEAMGAHVAAREGMRAPLAVRGAIPRGLEFENTTGSAQVKSAVLLAGLNLTAGRVVVRESRASRDHTERMLAWLGAPLAYGEGLITLEAGTVLRASEWRVPGDISAAMFLLVGAAITPGSRVTVDGVGLNPTRTGGLDALRRMGALLEIRPDPESGPEPTGEVTVAYGPLSAVEVGGDEVPRLIDEVPVLAVAAACASGVSHFTGLGELRVKESDRIAGTCGLLRTLGVEVEEEKDGFWVRGGELRGGRVASHGDHRIAMSALIAGCTSPDEVTVDSLAMVDTSDPGFCARLEGLRGERR